MKKTSRSIELHHQNYFTRKFPFVITLSQIKLYLIYNFSLQRINTRLFNTNYIVFHASKRTTQLVQIVDFIHSFSLSLSLSMVRL